MSDKLDEVRRSTLGTLTEIVAAEQTLKQACGDVRDEYEWMQLRDIVARIERRLMAANHAPETAP